MVFIPIDYIKISKNWYWCITHEFLFFIFKCQRTAGSFMKPIVFFEAFEITAISGSLILNLFFFPKEQKLTVLIFCNI